MIKTNNYINAFRRAQLSLGCFLILILIGVASPADPVKNGFDLENSLVPSSKIKGGGPPKDGIPALTDPDMIKAKNAKYLDASDQVIGINIKNNVRAFPLKILVHHEAVNDVVGDVPVTVTYWPLCNSSLVVNRRIGGEVREFGISGLLYNSNVLLYDRQSSETEESLWSQLEMRAIAGPAAENGLELELVPFEQTTWGEWTDKHPNSWVLSTDTGHKRNYQRNPYGRYFATQDLMFPVDKKRSDQPDLNAKDMLLVVHIDGHHKGYPFKRVVSSAGDSQQITDTVAGTKIRIELSKNKDNITAHYVKKSGKPPVSYMFWFAFQAGFSEAETELYNSDD